MSLVIDASVAVEFLLRTPLGTSVAPRLTKTELVAPELLDAEVLAVIRRAFLQKRIDVARAGEALEDLIAWKIRRIPNVSLVRTAWRYRENVSAYDALYLAAADRFGSSLLTADGPLSRAPVGGILIENVRLRKIV